MMYKMNRYSNDKRFGRQMTMGTRPDIKGRDKLGVFRERVVDYNAFVPESNFSENVAVGFRQYADVDLIVFEQVRKTRP